MSQGAQFSPNTSHVIRNQMVNDTRDRSSGRSGLLLKMSYFTANLQYTIFYNIVLGLRKMTKSYCRIDSWRRIKRKQSLQDKICVQFIIYCCHFSLHKVLISKVCVIRFFSSGFFIKGIHVVLCS
jgi:hypothetical protein